MAQDAVALRLQSHERPTLADRGHPWSGRRQADATCHQGGQQGNRSETDQFDIDDPAQTAGQSLTHIGELALPQGDGPEDVSDGRVQGQTTHGQIQTDLPPEERVLGVKLRALSEVDHAEDSTDQKRQGSDAVNDVGDHHRGGFTAIGIRLDQLPLQHESSETEHEAEVMHVGDTGVLGDVRGERDRQCHGLLQQGWARP